MRPHRRRTEYVRRNPSRAEYARRDPDPGNDEVRAAARAYMRSIGRELPSARPRVKVDPATGRRIALAYIAMENDPNDPEVRAAYNAFASELFDQWEFVKSVVQIDFTEGDPYPNSEAMRDDIRQNRRLRVFTGGEPHPILSYIVHPETGRSANDIFRAVHDVFGHAKEGNQFGPSGEENAWLDHSMMFSREAQRALTTETRGQNSYFNYAPQNEGKPVAEKQYAQQKAGLLPDEFLPPA